jgi:hypothetical protein
VISRINAGGEYEPAAADPQDESRLEAVLFYQQAPGVSGTDRAFFEGRWEGHQTPEKFKALDYAAAKAAGISTAGKVYMSGVADRRGPRDPEAWVDSVGSLKRLVQKRNMTCEGIVNNVAVELPPKPDVPLNDSIVNNIIAQETQKNPGLKAKPRQELREMVIDKHGRK